VCSFEGFGFLPPTLSSDFVPRRTTGKETLTEILVADIGDEIAKSTYLIVSNFDLAATSAAERQANLVI
jgi:cleavage and polyadenylation specificity factor subunit 1